MSASYSLAVPAPRSRVADILHSRGISIDRLAGEAGLTPSAVRGIVAGRVLPSVETALRLSEVLAVEIEEIFPGV